MLSLLYGKNIVKCLPTNVLYYYILSGDNNFIEKVRENLLYDKTMAYIELRQTIS